MLTFCQTIFRSSWISLLLVGSIVAGALIGHFAPAAGQALEAQIDRTLLALVGLLFFGVRFATIKQWRAWPTPSTRCSP